MGGWRRNTTKAQPFPKARETRIVFGAPVVCLIMCARLCVFLGLFGNPKEVITPKAGEFVGKMSPVWTGVGSWVPVEAGEGLLAP